MIAGGGTGVLGDGGPATKAKLNLPTAVAVDSAGNVLVADIGNDRVRVMAERTGDLLTRTIATFPSATGPTCHRDLLVPSRERTWR